MELEVKFEEIDTDIPVEFDESIKIEGGYEEGFANGEKSKEEAILGGEW